MANPVAPPGGYQAGGWYEGRQYWNGQFGAPGQIINPNQQGAGQRVSNEVIAQTNPKNVAYVQQQEQKYYNSPQEVQSALNTTQNNIFGGSIDVPSGVQSTSQIASDLKASGLLPTGSAPTAPNLVQTYSDLANAKGVDAIQGSITDLKAQADALVAQTRTNVSAEQGKPVATNIIEGRVSVQKTQAQDQLDFINRQLSRKQDELTSALGNIKMIMDFTQQDYSNASDSYNKQFDQAISTINLIHGIQQDQKTDAQRAQDNARANAQIFINSIKDGNLSIQNLPPDQQANLNKLEVQAGLPVGFFQAMKADPKANIISTSTDNGVTQVLMRNPDGSISVQKYGTSTAGGGNSGTTASSKSAIISAISADAKSGKSISQIFSAYQGLGVTPNEIYTQYNATSKYGADKNQDAIPGTGYLSKYGVTLFK